ncbi:MAG: 4Fe-4S binding protein [Bacteroidales bacterium]|nr:4Fe-4S binding protein [Bacteroidales bacterium]
MLKKIRIAIAAIFFIGITLLFVGIGQQWWGWMAKLQFLPACLALNLAVIVGLILLTLIFGRIYCSVICPLGIYQDLVNYFSSLRKNKKRRFKFKKEQKVIRYSILVAYIALLIAGVQVVVALLAPYSAYGRMVSSVVNPQGWAVPVIAAITFLVVTVFAWVGGRSYCNTICPVGTTLSLFARFSLLRPVIMVDKCKNCHGCEKKCKASCIDIKNHSIDYSRCVVCGDCISDCKFGAVKYGLACKSKQGGSCKNEKSEESVDGSKRAFMTGAAIVGATALMNAAENDGGLAVVIDKKVPSRTERLVPFGAGSVKKFYDKCTACQLCVSNCPNHVLRPSADLEHFMQPVMEYEKGYCRPECTICSQVCPAGAIVEITPAEKTAIHIGRATIDFSLCLASAEEVQCGNCARHCPAEAIQMVRKEGAAANAVRIPVVLEEKCIGCGACENLCPSRPISAIKVNGLSTHIND